MKKKHSVRVCVRVCVYVCMCVSMCACVSMCVCMRGERLWPLRPHLLAVCELCDGLDGVLLGAQGEGRGLVDLLGLLLLNLLLVELRQWD